MDGVGLGGGQEAFGSGAEGVGGRSSAGLVLAEEVDEVKVLGVLDDGGTINFIGRDTVLGELISLELAGEFSLIGREVHEGGDHEIGIAELRVEVEGAVDLETIF